MSMALARCRSIFTRFAPGPLKTFLAHFVREKAQPKITNFLPVNETLQNEH
jgi:hypothetical protein